MNRQKSTKTSKIRTLSKQKETMYNGNTWTLYFQYHISMQRPLLAKQLKSGIQIFPPAMNDKQVNISISTWKFFYFYILLTVRFTSRRLPAISNNIANYLMILLHQPSPLHVWLQVKSYPAQSHCFLLGYMFFTEVRAWSYLTESGGLALTRSAYYIFVY